MKRTVRNRAFVATVAGCLFANGAMAQSSSVGQWSDVRNWPIPAVHSTLLPNGKVLFNGEYRNGDMPQLWDPQTDQVVALPHLGYNPFCGGHGLLPDGRLFLVGGHIDNRLGLPETSRFELSTNTWTRLADMAQGRWYPTVTALPSGEMLVTAGSDQNGNHVAIPEIFNPSTGAWRRLTTASQLLPYYPTMFVLADGRVYQAGRETSTSFLDVSGTGRWTAGPPERYSGGSRQYASAAMYEKGKIIMIGGGDPPIPDVEVIDFNQPSPQWRSVQSMSIARRNHNAVVLPDGQVLVVGGSAGPGLNDTTHPANQTELWDPKTETWRLLATAPTYRGYHHTALLLPDGRVLSAGSTGVTTYMFFYPPYLFQGDRPVISSAPSEIQYNQPFDVGTPDDIAKVSLIRLPSVTHAFNQNGRYLTLAFTSTNSGLEIQAPASAFLAPPGHYMLFLLNASGVPSVAKMVHLSGSSPPPPPPPPVMDAGVPNVDAGTPGTDAGSPPVVDAGTPDAGASPDAGSSSTVTFSDEFSRVQSFGLGNGWTTPLGRWRVEQEAISDQSVPDLALAPVSCLDCTVESRLVGFRVPVTALALRAQGGPSYDRYEVAVTGTGSIEVRRVRSGAVTVLGTAASGIPDLTNWATVSASGSGSGPVSFTVRVNGVIRLSVTDTSGQAITGSGFPGIFTTRAGVAYDSFKVFGGTLATPPRTEDAGTPITGAIFSDNFNRTDANTLGANWVDRSGAFILRVGHAQSDRSGANLTLENSANCQNCTVESRLVGFGVPYAGLVLRSSDDGTAYYDAVVTSTGKVQIRRKVGGVATVLGEAPHGIPDVSSWATLTFSASGSTLSVKVNGVARVAVTDGALSGSGWAGMTTSTAGVPFDDFVVR